jgi:endonuclease-3
MAAKTPTPKRPLDIDEVFVRLREATRSFPQAQMFALRDQGYRSVFEQVVSCILSIRTLDEVSGPAALRLFAVARTPAEIARLSVDEIDALVDTVQFSYGKAGQIREIAAFTARTYGDDLPADYDVLTSLKGVGPKCANLTLGVARGVPAIAVDIHVHRVTNRWGYVAATTPEATLAQLEQKLPRQYWVEINERLVPFGKRICTGRAPRCPTCPLLEMCAQVGV